MNPRHAQPSRDITRPEPGFFKLRLVKGGPLVPARILYEPTADPETGEQLDRSWWWVALINGQAASEPSITPTEKVLHIWTSGERINEAEYLLMTARVDWDRKYDPEAPSNNPRQSINWRTEKLPF